MKFRIQDGELMEIYNPEKIFLQPVIKKVWMSPEEYITRCADILQTTPKALIAERIDDRLTGILKAFNEGKTFCMPSLNYIDKTQDGLHRAMAANTLGIEKIPVIIVDKNTNEVI